MPIREKPVQYGYFPYWPNSSQSNNARHFDNCKEKSREILDWLINKGIITWCFSYWPSYRSSVGLLYWRSAAPQANTAGLGPIIRPIWKTSRNNTILLINFDLLAFIWSNLSIQYKNFHWANTAKNPAVQYGYFPYWPNSSQSNNN